MRGIAPDAGTRRGLAAATTGVYATRQEYTMADLSRITASPAVMLGKPVVLGTRLTVEHLLEELAGGLSIDELLDSHPRLTIEDVRAVLAFAAGSVRMERLASVPVAS